MLRSTCILAVTCVLLAAAPSAALSAAERPLQLSLFTPLQIVPEEDTISLFRLNLIYGRNVSIRGLDLGLVNHTTRGESRGVQWGMVSWNEADFTGWQYGTVNATAGNFKGFQWGFVNYARSARGLQLGFVNYSETMHGLQIGFVNMIKEGGVFPVLPIVNWSF